MTEVRRWLPVLAPPPGGELRLRRALRSAPHRSPAPRRVYAVTAVAAALAMLVVLALPSADTPDRRMQAALRTALTTAPPDLVVHEGAALRLPSDDPHVRIYLVASSPALPSR